MDASRIALLSALVAVVGGLIAVFVALSVTQAAKRKAEPEGGGGATFDNGRKGDLDDAGDGGGDGGGSGD